MKIMEKIKRIVRLEGNKEKNDLRTWQDRFERSKMAYQSTLDLISEREDLYNGTRRIDPNVNSSIQKVVKKANHVRNIVFELVEAQIDSNVPIPKVTSACQSCKEKAYIIEDMLKDEMEKMPFQQMNDEQERTTPIQGGSFFLVEWDNSKRTHTTVGDLRVSLLHPQQVIPQEGMTNILESDYIFVMVSRSKDYIKRRYGVDVDDEVDSNPELSSKSGDITPEDKVTQIIAYYRSDKGNIGIFSWVNDVVIEDIDDYQARKLDKCKKCGRIRIDEEEKCTCGCKEWEKGNIDYEELNEDIVLDDGTVIPAMSPKMEDGAPVLDEYGSVIYEKTKIPFYKPNIFPLVLRKNVSAYNQLLGDSDTDKIRDQQMTINKLGSKIEEKLLMGGSILTLPRGISFRKDDTEFKVVNVNSPADVSSIQAITLQPNISYDSAERDKAVSEAQSILGITDTFLGKPDKTATSGRAKEVQVQQSAGRLESKRRMKSAAYSELFRAMFLFLLAYADEDRSFLIRSDHQKGEYGTFSRYMFLEQDAAGEWYYNTDYMFSTDEAGSLSTNREAMWQETRMNFQQGTFGDPALTQTRIIFWRLMEQLRYPKAGEIKKQLEQFAEQEEQASQMQALQMQNIATNAAQMQAPVQEQQAMVVQDIPNTGNELDAILAELED